MLFKLGRLPSTRDHRSLQFSRFAFHAALPPIPPKWDWSRDAGLEDVYENETLGDCTIAGMAHAFDIESLVETGKEVHFPDKAIITAYSGACGFDPAAPLVKDPDTGEMVNPTDQGGSELDVLKYMRATGLVGPDGASRKVKAYRFVDPKNQEHWTAANYLFGGSYLGIVLPAFVEPLMGPGHDWAWPTNPSKDDLKPLGGHAVWQVAYDRTVKDRNDPAGATISTWGMKKRVSQMFLDIVTEEAWAVLLWEMVPTVMPFVDYGLFVKDLDSVAA